jgi:hypothetical protein
LPMTFDLPVPANEVRALNDLSPSEQFVVRAFRRWVQGMWGMPSMHTNVVWNDFARELGAADGKAALRHFAAFIHGVGGNARRPFRHHKPCCPCVTKDELWLVRMVHGGQHGNRSLVEAAADWLIEPRGQASVIDSATRFGAVLHRHGLTLPQRCDPPLAGRLPSRPPSGPALVPFSEAAPSARIGRDEANSERGRIPGALTNLVGDTEAS